MGRAYASTASRPSSRGHFHGPWQFLPARAARCLHGQASEELKSTCSPKTLSGAGSSRPTEATGSRVAFAGSRLVRAVRLAQQQPSKLARAAQTHLEGPL